MRNQVVKDIEKEFLEPSFQYLVENGLENTSVRDLCKAMGVSYGSLYYWFDGKEDIYINVVKYGVEKVADKLFKVAFERMHDPKLFFDTFLDEVDKYRKELRRVFQFATSPDYGKAVQKKSEEFKAVYEKYIIELSHLTNIKPEIMAPIIYLLISILVDYCVWEDREASDMQMKFLYNTILTLQNVKI